MSKTVRETVLGGIPGAVLGIFLLHTLSWAQASPRVTGVAPETAKVGANLTVNGENLGKEIVEAVYLSDDAKDYKADIAEQTASKVVLKIPELKAGPYNISLKVGDNIFIQPTRVTIE